MSLYDDAGLISLPTGAAGKEGMLYSIKPVEKLKDAERLTNGDFSDGSTGWTVGNHITISNGEAVFDGNSGAYANLKWVGAFESGKTYKVSLQATVREGSITVADSSSGNSSNLVKTSGNHSFYITAGSTELHFVSFNTPLDLTIDNVSVREVEQEAKDFVFERNSNLTATRVGPGGLIEKGRENHLLYSNQLDTTWTVISASLTGGKSGYDGSSNAWELKATGNGSTHLARLNQTSLSVSGISTFSVYAKAGNVNWIRLNALTNGTNVNNYFDLSGNGAVGASPSNTVVESKIESVGSDWFRISVTSKGEASIYEVRIQVAEADGDEIPATNSYVFIQNAQLEAGLVATDYMYSGSTTGKAGILEDEPRFDHTGGGCPGLLLEGEIVKNVPIQNLVPYSEYFTFEGRTTITYNHDTSPEGVENSTKFTNTTETGAHRTHTDIFDVTSGDTYTASVFAKKGSLKKLSFKVMASNEADIGFDEPIFNLDDGTIGGDSSNASMVDYGNGWYRCIVTSSPTSTPSDARVYFYFRKDDDTKSYTGTTSQNMEIWGAQVEESSFATSYIPTHGTAATRVRDDVGVISNTTTDGLTNGYNTTIYCKFKLLAEDRNSITGLINYYVPLSGLQNDPRMLLYTGSTSGGVFSVRIQYRVGNVGDHDLIIETPTNYNVGDEVKAIARITDYDVTLFVNGTKFTFEDYATSATAGRTFKKSLSGSTMNGIDLTYSPTAAQHELYEVITFPKVLTDDECEDLTTL